MERKVTLAEKGLKRFVVLTQAQEGKMTGIQASAVMGVSLRHERRLMAAFRKEGADALIHGNRGRKPAHAISEELKSQIFYLAEVIPDSIISILPSFWKNVKGLSYPVPQYAAYC